MARLPLRSPLVAAWLFAAAFVIVVLIGVGGATRLTQSGLSITEWKPIHGVIPPTNDGEWQQEFAEYKKIPQFKQINPRMTVSEFKGIYWWEWTHRLLARGLGLVYVLGFAAFLLLKEIPGRLIWRCGALVGLVAFQGLVGWLMVKSGLEFRVAVAPEMLMFHLGMALLLLIGTVWTALEAAEGQMRWRGAPLPWRAAAAGFLGLVFLQCLLGALVAGNRAGLVYNDFPLMNGEFVPAIDWAKGVGYSFLHDQGLVQFMHRINAYLVLIYSVVFIVWMNQKANDDALRSTGTLAAVLVWAQAALGIATLVTVVNIWLALSHQILAVLLLILVTVLTWRVFRADRVFRTSGF
ncbi:COX15/CtaA family protein [Asticcacaulis sp. AC460]|uniref:COX15/CtaA family protein n=1 Tax=Asticcacaulis sp. AC460 TaxID=1282360 RepID=UPI0004CE9B78|nr:COX15/CtaA family protein [Asticcacaulis sp. AC460]